MRLNLRIVKPRTTLTVDISGVGGADHNDSPPCLKDLHHKALQCFSNLHLDLQKLEKCEPMQSLTFSLNNKDILCGDDLPLSEFGIVNGDLIYVHLPASMIVSTGNDPEPTDKVTKSQKLESSDRATSQVMETDKATSQVMETDKATCGDPVSRDASELCEMEAECSYSESRKHDTQSHTANDQDPDNTVELPGISAEDYATVNDVQELSVKEVNRYMNQAVLVRDTEDGDHGNIPHSLQIALDHVKPQSQHQCILVIIHVLILETGFVLRDSSSLCEDIVKSGSPRLEYDYKDEKAGFSLVAVPMNKTLVIHAVSRSDAAVRYNINVRPSSYVTISNQGSAKFHKLAQLSRDIKDKITYPMLQCLTNDEYNGAPSLTNLLHEIKTVILKYLDARSLLRLSETCTVYRDLCMSPVYWYRLFIQDYGKSKAGSKDTRQNWLRLYKDQYVMRKRVHEQMRRTRFVVPPYIGRHPPLPRLPPWVPPFMVGGDYDRLPGAPLFPGMGGGVFPRSPRYDPIGPLPDNLHEPGRGGIYPMVPDFGPRMMNPLLAPNMGPRRNGPGRGRGQPGHGFGSHRPMFF